MVAKGDIVLPFLQLQFYVEAIAAQQLTSYPFACFIKNHILRYSLGITPAKNDLLTEATDGRSLPERKANISSNTSRFRLSAETMSVLQIEVAFISSQECVTGLIGDYSRGSLWRFVSRDSPLTYYGVIWLHLHVYTKRVKLIRLGRLGSLRGMGQKRFDCRKQKFGRKNSISYMYMYNTRRQHLIYFIESFF